MCFTSLSRKNKDVPEKECYASKRSKYQVNGIFVIDDFPNKIGNTNRIEIDLELYGGVSWYMSLYGNFSNISVWPSIGHRYVTERPSLIINAFFNFINEKNGERFEKVIRFSEFNSLEFGPHLEIEKILNENNGWLKDGKLSIEYGLHVASYRGKDKLWRFFFDGKVFECKDKNNMVRLWHSENENSQYFGFHKQLVNFHTTNFHSEDNKIFIERDMDIEAVRDCFQLAHGVHIKLKDLSYLVSSLKIASHYKLSNVIKYLETQIIQCHYFTCYDLFWLEEAVTFNMRHLLTYTC